MAAASTALAVDPKMSAATSQPSPELAPLPKPVVFATSGLGGMLGWVIVHPANTVAGAYI